MARPVDPEPTGRPVRAWHVALVGAACGLAVGLLHLAGGLADAEELSLGWRFHLRGPRPAQAPVAIVAIDEGSLRRYGQFPWDRHLFARLLDVLGTDGVPAVAFDVAFVEPGHQAPGEDAALLSAFPRVPRVVLPTFRAASTDPLARDARGRGGLVKPLPALERAASGLGIAQFTEANQRDVVGVEPVQRVGDRLWPTLSLATARAMGAPPLPDAPWLTGSPIALDDLGPPGSIPSYPFWRVLAGQVPASALRGHAVLVGATATGLPDTGFTTPWGDPIAGVEIHATAVENLLGRGPLRQPAPWVTVALLTAIGLGPGSWLLDPRRGPLQRLAATGAWIAGATVLAALAYLQARAWLGLVPLVLLGAACGGVGTLWHALHLREERNAILEWYATELRREAGRERAQIDGELHDEAQQLLIVLLREIRALGKRLGGPAGTSDGAPEGAAAGRAEALAQRILQEIHRVRRNLVPPALARGGLVAAADELAQDLVHRGLPTRVEHRQWPRELDPWVASEVYWLVKEATNNAFKHARATSLTIAFDATDAELVVEVADDGRGFTPSPLSRPPTSHEHTGLHRMWLRARSLGGDLEVDSAPGRGTRMRVRVPWERGRSGRRSPRFRLASRTPLDGDTQEVLR